MIGARIRTLRLKHQYTQSKLAQLAELSTSAIGMYEHSRREPDSKTLIKFSKIFNVPVGYFFEECEGVESQESDTKELYQFLCEVKEKYLSYKQIVVDEIPLDRQEMQEVFDIIEKEIQSAVARKKKS